MREAKQYQEYLNLAKTAAERRLSLMREETTVYNNMVPLYDKTGNLEDSYASRQLTQSKYLSPDYCLAADTYAESMIYNFPTFDFEANDRLFSKEEVDRLNKIFTKVAFANNLSYKMMNVIRIGIRKGFCACELVPTTIIVNREIKVNGKWQKDEETTFSGVLDLIKYLPHQTLIDPNADPDDVRSTAEYCIAYLGFFSKSIYETMAKRYGWEVNSKIEEVNATTFTDEGGEEQEKNLEGLQRGPGVKVSKLFLADGTVQVVVNDKWVVAERINDKRIGRMPIIFYKSRPGGSTPYGRMLWQMMRPSVMALSVGTNLILDNVGKNLAGVTFTTIKELAEQNMNDYENGQIVYLRTADENRDLKSQTHRVEFPDMTQGAQFAIGKFREDVARISHLDTLSQGSQGQQQVRTNYIAEQLSQPSISQKSAFV
jgi:hypothetical protein